MRSSSSGCARRARSCSARRTSASGRTSARRTRRAAGRARGGQARNPYALDRTPVGLELGLGDRASAANYCAVAVGTETDGSITSPVGGVLARRHQADGRAREPQRHRPDLAHAGHRRPDGAHRRRRRGAARRASPARDPRDAATATARRAADYVAALDANGLKGARIGVAREQVHGLQPPRPTPRSSAALAVMKDRGAVDRRSGRHRHRRQVRRRRVRGAALRVQGRPRTRTSRRRPGVARADADRPHRVQPTRTPTPRCRTSARRSSSTAAKKGPLTERGVPEGARARAATVARTKGSTPRSRSTGSTRSSLRRRGRRR